LLRAHPHLRVLGIDQDPDAVRAAAQRLAPFGWRAEVYHARFDAVNHIVHAASSGRTSVADAGSVADRPAPAAVVGVLFDLGVSSPQLDRSERGFSYRHDGPLDMRMDTGAATSAAQLVNELPEAELARLFAANGEGRLARRLARAVVAARPVTTTGQLVEAILGAVPAPARRRSGHPARRVFQAIRIAVNDELDVLARSLPAAIDLLTPGGRCVAIAYHSGEDRLVKAAFTEAVTGGCTCPPTLPCVCGAVPIARLVFRGARRPLPAEVEKNRRSESARLRALERLADRSTP
jgi:16S rRNA (cytosine1402-N4)-methyltransferase